MAMVIKTNNQYRDIVYGYELPDEVLKEFDYLSNEDLFSAMFIKYKGEWYDLGEFLPVNSVMALHNPDLAKWSGYQSDSYFSGVVIKFDNDFERVILGTYYS